MTRSQSHELTVQKGLQTFNLDTNLNLITIDWEDYHANATLFALNDYGDHLIFAH